MKFNIQFSPIFIAFLLIFMSSQLSAQLKIGNNPTTINANSLLELEHTTKGFLLPRLTLSATTLASPLTAHVAGMVVYNTATVSDVSPGFYYNDGTKWVRLSTSATPNNTTAANNLITITNGAGATLTAMTVAVDTNVLKSFIANNVKNSPIKDSLTTIINNQIFGGSITGKDLSNSNGIIVTGGTGTTLKATRLRLDSSAIAKMMGQSPVKDSTIKIFTTGAGRDSIINTVNTQITTGNVTGQDLTSESGGALIVNGGAGTTLKTTKIAVNKDSIVTSTQVSKVINTAPARDSIISTVNTQITAGNVTGNNLTAGSLLQTTGTPTGASLKTAGYQVDTNALKSFVANNVNKAPIKDSLTTVINNNFSSGTLTGKNTTGGSLITVTNGTGAAVKDNSIAVDTTALKTFISNTATSGTITGQNLTAGSLLQTTGTPTGASLKTAGYQVDTTALKTFISNTATSGTITGQNLTAGSLLQTTGTPTGASLKTAGYQVDTTALKTFISNTATSGTITGQNLTAGSLLQTTGTPTGASLKTAGYQVDTTALKTFISNTATSGTITGQNLTAGSLLQTTGTPTGASLKTAGYRVDTTALKTFISNTATSGTITGQNLTAGSLLQTTGTPTGASLKTAGYQVDTTALKTFITNTATSGTITGQNLTAGSLLQTTGTPTGASLKTAGYQVDTNALKSFVANNVNKAPIKDSLTTVINNNFSSGTLTGKNTTGGSLITVTNGTGAAVKDNSIAVDTTALKTFVTNNINGGSISGQNLTAGSLLQTTGTPTGASLKTAGYQVDTTALKTFISNTATSGTITGQNLTAGSLLQTTGTPTGASLKTAGYQVDTTALKTFISNTATSGTITGQNTTGGQLITVTNGSGAALKNNSIAVDTTALKTFITNTAASGTITGQNLTAGSLLQTTGTPTGASLKTAGYRVDTTALKTFISNTATSGSITGQNLTAGSLLQTTGTPAGASLKTAGYQVDTTALKTFISNTATSGTITGQNLTAGSLLQTTGTPTGASLKTAGYQVDTNALKSFVANNVNKAPIKDSLTTVINNNFSSGTLTGKNTTGGSLITVTNGTGAAVKDNSIAVDTTALKSFVTNNINGGSITGQNLTAGSLLQTTGTPTGASLKTAGYRVDTTALKTFISNTATSGTITGQNTTGGQLITVTNGSGAALKNNSIAVDTTALKTFISNTATSGTITGQNLTAGSLLQTTGTPTGASLKTAGYQVDTTALKTFISNTATSGTITGQNLTAGSLLQTTGTPTGASLKTAGYQVDTIALKTFISNTATSGTITGQNTTGGQLITVTNGSGAALKNNSIAVDTTALKTFISNTATSGSITGQNLTAGSLLQTTGTPTGASLKTAGYRVDTTALKTFISNSATSGTITGQNLTAGSLLQTTGTPTGASLKTAGYQVDTTALKTFITNTATSGTITGQNLTAGSLLQTTGTPTGASLKTAGYQVDTNALKSFVANNVNKAPIKDSLTTVINNNFSSGTLTGKNTTGGSLITVTNGTGAAVKDNSIAVDTTALKTFISNTATSGTITGQNLTAGSLLQTTGTPTGASLKTAGYQVDTTALKTFINGRTTNTLSSAVNTMTNTTNGVVATAPIVNSISNTFTPATRALVTTVNGVAGTAVTLTDGPDSTLANNGLSLSGDTVQLGGSLTKATTVTTSATNTIALAGLQSGTTSDSIVVANASTGVIGRRSLTAVSSAAEPWFNQATNSAATANTQNIYQLGNVGVGIASPLKRLHVQAGGSSLLTGSFGDGMLLSTNGAAGTRFFIEHTTAASNQKTMALYNQAGITKFSTVSDTGTAFLRDGIISLTHSTGNVGINNTLPTNSLDVSSTANPLRLRGLQSGAVSDSILTNDATGVVRMRSLNAIVAEPWFKVGTSAGATRNTDSIYIMNSVGIGTTTPSRKLHVQGNAIFAPNTANDGVTGEPVSVEVYGKLPVGLASQVGGIKMNWYSASSGMELIRGISVNGAGLAFNVSDAVASSTPAEAMRIMYNGYTGIGTTAPTNRLDVTDTANPLRLRGLKSGVTSDSILTADATGVVRMRSLTAVSSATEPWFIQATNQAATSNTQNIYQMGNVGIGTTTPLAKLNAVGQIRSTGIGPNAGQFSLSRLNGSEAAPTAVLNTQLMGSILFGGYNGSAYVNTTSINARASEDYTATNQGSHLAFNTTLNGTVTPAERMRIDHNGNIGIGTISPTNKLDIVDTANPIRLRILKSGATSDSILTADASGVVRMRNITSVSSAAEPWFKVGTSAGATKNTDSIYLMGNVGIGITTPVTTLHVNNRLQATNTVNADAQVLQLSRPILPSFKNSNIAQFNLGSYSASSSNALTRLDLSLNDVGSSPLTTVMTWQANGNVGLGTTAPTNRLDVTDTANPLRLRGLKSGATSDSVLTADATGVVRKIDPTQVGNFKTIATKTANYSFLATDYTILMNCTAGALTVTLPAAASNTGRIIVVSKYDETANVLTFSPAIRQSVSTTIASVNTQITYTLQSNGSDWVIIGKF